MVRRGQRTILDRELVAIYGVTTDRFNEAVKRNAERFPVNYMFQLTAQETENLRSKFAISSWGGWRYRPFAFTELGAIQAANVLNSPRAFVQLRELLASNKELARRFKQLEARLDKKLADHDDAIAVIRQLMNPPALKRHGIGFIANIETQE